MTIRLEGLFDCAPLRLLAFFRSFFFKESLIPASLDVVLGKLLAAQARP
jgi:hypothetical protein